MVLLTNELYILEFFTGSIGVCLLIWIFELLICIKIKLLQQKHTTEIEYLLQTVSWFVIIFFKKKFGK